MAEIVVTEEKQQTPETLAEMMDDVRPVYTGHPAASDDEIVADESIADDKTVIEELETSPTDTKVETEVKEPPDEPDFKYKSHEEAERGYREAEKLIGKSTDEAKLERERAENLQRQLNEALLQGAPGIPEVKEEPEPVKTVTNAERMQNALVKIAREDPTDNDYDLKVGTIWGQTFDEIQAEIQGASDTKIQAILDKHYKDRQDEQKRDDDERDAQDKIVADATKTATSEGLDMSEGSSDSELFWAFAGTVPGGSLEDQTKRTIEKVKKHQKTVVVDKEKTRKTQEQNAVLERAGEKPLEKQGPVQPLTLGDAFAQTERRI